MEICAHISIPKYVQILKSQWFFTIDSPWSSAPCHGAGGLQRLAEQAPKDFGAHGATAAGKSEVLGVQFVQLWA